MVRKTTTQEEKLDMLVEFFVEKALPFSLKELENQVPKSKPACRSMLIKELLEFLIADGRIESDKIGAGRFYWLFPAAAAQRSKKRKADLEREIDSFEEKKRKLNEEISEAQLGKENTEERKELIKEMKALEEKSKELDEKLAKYADFDPELVAKMKTDATLAKDAANRWTDNIFQIKKYARNNMNMDSKDFDRMFDIPADFDNIE